MARPIDQDAVDDLLESFCALYGLEDGKEVTITIVLGAPHADGSRATPHIRIMGGDYCETAVKAEQLGRPIEEAFDMLFGSVRAKLSSKMRRVKMLMEGHGRYKRDV